MRRLWAAVLALLLLPGWSAAARPAARPRAKSMTLESKAARFRCSAPRWDESEDPAADAREKVYGVTLREPGAGADAATITVEWYAPGNTLFPRPEDFLAVNASTAGMAVAGSSVGAVERLTVAGRPARRWRSQTSRPSAPNAVRAALEKVITEQVVVEASSGFYALSFSAPAGSFDAKRAAFRRLVDTFKPLP